MIFKKLTYLILIAVLAMSCHKKTAETEIEIVPQSSKVKFSVAVNEFSVRGQTSTALLPEESRIFNYAVLIFDAAEHLEAFLTASPYSPNVPGSTGIDYDGSLIFTDEQGDEIALQITAGKKYVFALINAPRPMLEWWEAFLAEKEATLDKFKSWIFEAGENGGLEVITGKTAVPQGDERGFMMTTKEGAQMVYLEPTDDHDGDPVTISIEAGRAMAKVSVSSSLKVLRDPEQQPNGVLTDITYKVINNPSEMFLIPHFENGQLITPYYYTHSGDGVDTDLYFESPGSLEDNYEPLSKPGQLTYVYCMENANHTPNGNNATIALLKGVFTPDSLYMADGQTLCTDYKTGDTFWRVVEIKDGERGQYLEKYYAQDPSSRLEEGYAAIAYPGGETLYPVMLYNAENPEAPYTVKRNSYYHIELTKVNGAGDSTEDKIIYPPLTPDEKVPIQVTIQIMEWEEIKQSGII